MTTETAPRCHGDSFLRWGTTAEGEWHVQIECNGGADGDCGWFLTLDLDSDDGLTSDDLREYQDRHELHRTALACEDGA